VESIAGALLIDTRLDLDQVWRVFEPLLSPLVTPDKLQLPPYRELNELCDSLGYFFRVKCSNDGVKAQATIQLQLDDVLLTGDGSEQTNKLALGKAASHLLTQLEVYIYILMFPLACVGVCAETFFGSSEEKHFT